MLSVAVVLPRGLSRRRLRLSGFTCGCWLTRIRRLLLLLLLDTSDTRYSKFNTTHAHKEQFDLTLCDCILLSYTHRLEVYDRTVGHDRVVSLHEVQLAATVLGCFIEAVDGAALGAGADGHARDGLIAADAVHRPCPTTTRLQLLQTPKTREKTEGEQGRGGETHRTETRQAYKPMQSQLHHG